MPVAFRARRRLLPDVSSRTRALAVFIAVALGAALLPTVGTAVGAKPPVPKVRPGAGPVSRPLPASVRGDRAVPADKRPPVVPQGIRAAGRPAKLTTQQWSRLTTDRARAAAVAGAFSGLSLRPGFVLGDTSLVLYFSAAGVDPSWSSATVRLYELGAQTEQASTSLSRKDLEALSACGGVGDFCRSFGGRDGWVVDPAKDYVVTVAAVFDDGHEVVSDPSPSARPRQTIDPPAVPSSQAAGCGCGNALAQTASVQASRAIGVNTGTGAFVRVEQDLAMSSFGIQFGSARTYSSGNQAPGLLGVGWAWSYDMRVSATADGAVVRAEDGAAATYQLRDDGSYARPAGVRSTLRKTADGWQLVTPGQVTYTFTADGRLASVVNARGKGVRLGYNDQAVTVTDASGRVAKAYLQDGLIRRIALPDGRDVSYGYENSRLAYVIDARGRKWTYKYDAAGLLAEVVNPDRVVALHNDYDPATGRVAAQSDALGARTTFGWNATAQEAKTTDPDGVVIWDGYRGNVLVYSQHGTGDSDNHRYDGNLNRNLVVNGSQFQHESTFDGNGNQTSADARELGIGEKVKYDGHNNPVEHTDARGNVWRDTYNDFNELVSSVDREGHRITYEYDDRGLRTSMTDQRGKVTRYEYLPDGDGNAGLLAAVISPEGHRAEFGYDRTGRRTKQVDPRGTVPKANRSAYTTEYEYDNQDRVLAVHDPAKSGAWRTTYDDEGRIARRETPEGVATTYTYFASGLPKKVQSGPRATAYTYTAAGRRASMRILMDPGDDLVTTYTYDAKGLLKTVTSPRGNVPGANAADFTVTYFYDANDNPIRIRRPYPGGGFVDRDIKVDGLDRTTAQVDEFNKTSSFERDDTGNITATTDTLGRTTRMEYDRNGRQTQTTDSGGKATKTEYDAAGNKIKDTRPTGGVTTWTYDDDGLLASITEPRGNETGADPARFTTRFEYDPAGNRIAMTDPLGNVTRYEYDANNRMTAVTDAKGRTTRYTYRDDNQLRTVHTPDAPWLPLLPTFDSTVYGYDADGLLAEVRDPQGHATRMSYDDAGRLTEEVDPLGRREQISYDAENDATTAITLRPLEKVGSDERARRTVVNTYDILGRLTNQALGSQGPVYTFGYDAKDRITSYGDPAGVRDVSYDDEDQIKTVTRREAGREDEVYGYGYDERGNIASRTYPDGTRVTAGYDADSRLTGLTVAGGSAGAAAATWSFGYDAAGHRTSTTLPAPTGLVERRGYDDAGRLTGIGTERSPDAPDPPAGVQDPVSAFQLTLDQVGNPTRMVTTRGGVSESVAYGYDEVDRVSSACYAATECGDHAKAAGRIDYTYDLVGNRTSQKRTGTAGNDTTLYAYDDADQLTLATRTSRTGAELTRYEYDVNGNQTRAGADRFTYNLDNSLAKADVDGKSTVYGYDAQRMRLSATTGSGDAASTRRWSWDVNGTLPQIAVDTVVDPAGHPTGRQAYAYGSDDEPLALLEPGGGAHAYTHDWLGGVADMLTPGGQVEAAYDYDPFGNPRTGPTLPGGQAGGADNPLRFAGAYQDSSTGQGNYHLLARTYNPATGRLTTTDPQPTGTAAVSAYAYAGNNPLVYTDPTGTMVLADGGGGASDSTTATTAPGQEVPTGPSAEDVAKAQQLQSKSVLDVVLEAGGQILMEVLGITDVLNCLKGDLGACVMAVVGSLPWGKIFKAKKIAEAIFKAGKAVLSFLKELEWAKAILRGAERAAEAAKAAAAAAAREAAARAAAAKAAAEAYAKKVAAEAAARARALAAKAKAATRSAADRCATRNSFAAGTLVLLANGTTKPIEDVQPGDAVAAAEPSAGTAQSRQVTDTIRTDTDKEYVDVTVRSPGTTAKATATAHHPFWSATRGRWVDAGDLRPGELLKTAAGTYVQVTAVRSYPGTRRTYNLTVDDLHAYFVVVGGAAVLVHNDPVDPYEVGTFDDLKNRSVAGDQLDIHHLPQKHPAGQVIPGYDPKTAPAIAAPQAEHRQIPTRRGPYTGTGRDLVQGDLADLAQHTNAPPSAVDAMKKQINSQFPGQNLC
ncbi:MAG: hypothetical protein V7603_4790 [Micromonosporaceae bacterium]